MNDIVHQAQAEKLERARIQSRNGVVLQNTLS
jgi:hypothetical protein